MNFFFFFPDSTSRTAQNRVPARTSTTHDMISLKAKCRLQKPKNPKTHQWVMGTGVKIIQGREHE